MVRKQRKGALALLYTPAPADGINKESNDERGADGAAQVDAGQHVDPLPVRAEALQLQGGGEAAGGGVGGRLRLLLRPGDDLGGAVGGPAQQQVRLVEGEALVRARRQHCAGVNKNMFKIS
jgi:hypothetical protein